PARPARPPALHVQQLRPPPVPDLHGAVRQPARHQHHRHPAGGSVRAWRAGRRRREPLASHRGPDGWPGQRAGGAPLHHVVVHRVHRYPHLHGRLEQPSLREPARRGDDLRLQGRRRRISPVGARGPHRSAPWRQSLVKRARPLLVLGVGNVYYGDEGAGVHLMHYLRTKYVFPEGVDVVDGGTLGWHLLNLIAEYDHVVLVDAVAAPVGKVYRFDHETVPAEIGYGKLSSHEWEVPDLLTAMQLHGDLPEVTIVAIGVKPLEFET